MRFGAVGIQRGCCPTGALGWLWTVPCVLPWPLSSSGALPLALRPHKGCQAVERGHGWRPDLLPVAQAGRPCHALSFPQPARPFSPTLGQSAVDQAVVSALLQTRLSSLHPLLCLLCSGLVAGPEPVGRHPVAGRAVPANCLGLEKEHSRPSIQRFSMDVEGACRGLFLFPCTKPPDGPRAKTRCGVGTPAVRRAVCGGRHRPRAGGPQGSRAAGQD